MKSVAPGWQAQARRLTAVLGGVRHRATACDAEARWPVEDLSELADIGALLWALPVDCGGLDVPAVELHLLYERIAAASLATALILAQRDAAIGFIDASPNLALRARLLRQLAADSAWTSVGIAQLTTSAQPGTTPLRARRVSGGFEVNGNIPWCTGGGQAAFVVVGSVIDATPDQEAAQLLFSLPTDAPGATVNAPQRLIALAATATCSIDCAAVFVPDDHVLHGPTAAALARRSKSVPIGQAFAALGLSRGAIALLGEIDSAAARQTRDVLQRRLEDIHHTVVTEYGNADSHNLQQGPLLRSECNDLAIRATHAAVTLFKGAGLRMDHPAQRLAREALFLLVWSSPASVVDRTLELFADPA